MLITNFKSDYLALDRKYSVQNGYTTGIYKLYNADAEVEAFGLYTKLYLLAKDNYDSGFFGIHFNYRVLGERMKLAHVTLKKLLTKMESYGVITLLNGTERVYGTIIVFNDIFQCEDVYIDAVIKFGKDRFQRNGK
jgi:hypothetical protein